MSQSRRLIAGETVKATAEVVGQWYRCPPWLQLATISFLQSSATGTPQVSYAVHLSYAGDEKPADDTTDYVSETIVTDSVETTRQVSRPQGMRTQARWIRGYAKGGAANPADTVATLAMTW